MKKVFFIFNIFFTIYLFSVENYSLKDWTKTDYENCSLKGKVKSIVHTYGKLYNDVNEFTDTVFYKKIEVDFTNSGNLKKVSVYNDNNTAPVNTNLYSFDYKTDKKNGFYIYDKDEKNIYKSIFVFDKAGNISKEIIYYDVLQNIPSRNILYYYNKKNQLIKKESRDMEDVIRSETDISYDKDKISKITTTMDGNIIYDENFGYEKENLIYYSLKDTKKIIEKNYQFENNFLISEVALEAGRLVLRNYKYDKDKNLSSYAEFDENEKLKFLVKFKYDKQGNFIEKLKFKLNEDKKLAPDEVETRKISYF